MNQIKTKNCENYDIYSMYSCLKMRGIMVRWINTGNSFMATAADGRKCRWIA